MKKTTFALLAATVLGAAGMAATTAPAQAAGVTFSVQLGDVQIAYSDGYYDRHRRWHPWRNANERKWYQRNHRSSYFGVSRNRDNDRRRRDWRNGKRNNWH